MFRSARVTCALKYFQRRAAEESPNRILHENHYVKLYRHLQNTLIKKHQMTRRSRIVLVIVAVLIASAFLLLATPWSSANDEEVSGVVTSARKSVDRPVPDRTDGGDAESLRTGM